MKINHVKGNTYNIETCSSFIPFYKINENDIIMLDSGLYDIETKIIKDILINYNFNVKAVVCSHAHVDHVGNNSWLKEQYNAEIIMPEYESFIFESIYNIKSYLYKTHIRDMEKIYTPMLFKTDRKISADSEYIVVCGKKFQIVQLHGHSYYHLGIITPDNVFYVGDSLMSKEVIIESKMSYIADIRKDIESKEKIRQIKCDKYILAHKGVYDEIDEIIDANLSFIEEQVQFVIDIIRKKPMTFEEVCSEVFMGLNIRKDVIKYVLTQGIIMNFINYFIEYGIVRLEIRDNTLKYCFNKHSIIN
ncbi:MAG: MBL fold metallo-hydrolase [Tissierellia bacterium]|nr:MBL fold metallo-hydrolase [Tissierellia bacterium]MDD4781713.1 MBL fold metallo-hydrolase [Tissierellia bacterium]